MRNFLSLVMQHGLLYVLRYKLGLAVYGIDFVDVGEDPD